MAFAVALHTRIQIAGRWYHFIVAGGDEIASATELELPNVPPVGRCLLCKWELLDGAGTTLAPSIGLEAEWTGELAVAAEYDAAAFDRVSDEWSYFAPEGSLWLRPTPDAGTDNEAQVHLLILEGGP